MTRITRIITSISLSKDALDSLVNYICETCAIRNQWLIDGSVSSEYDSDGDTVYIDSNEYGRGIELYTQSETGILTKVVFKLRS